MDHVYMVFKKTYRAPAYRGHHEQMQQNNSVNIESAINSANAISSQNRKRFSAR